MLRSEDIRH